MGIPRCGLKGMTCFSYDILYYFQSLFSLCAQQRTDHLPTQSGWPPKWSKDGKTQHAKALLMQGILSWSIPSTKSHWSHHSVLVRLTPFFPYPTLQVTPISPNYAQLSLRVPVHRSTARSQNPHQNALPWPWGCNGLPRSHGSSHDNHTTMHHLISQSLSQWTWDLKVPTLFISIYIHLTAC